VNLYGGSELATGLDGEKIKLMQETEYPWSGRVRIKIEACGKKEFALKLRIPGWAKGASVRINDRPPWSAGVSPARRGSIVREARRRDAGAPGQLF